MTDFERRRDIYTLEWGDGEKLAGLVVKARSLSMKAILDLMPMIDSVHSDRPDMSQIDVLLRRFGSSLIEWNLVDEDGKPVPATYEAFTEEDPAFVSALLKAWTEAFAVVDPTSKPPSSRGATEAAMEFPMETTPACWAS